MTAAHSEPVPVLRALPVWLWVFAVGWIALAVYWQWLVHRDGIFGDMWDMLPGYQRLQQMDVAALWQELTARYAGVHVLAIPKLFFWLNFSFFHGSGVLLKTASFLLCLANAVLLLKLTAREWSGSVRPALLCLMLLLVFFNGLQALVIDWDFLLQHYLAVFFSLSAFLLYRHTHHLPIIFFLVLLAVFSCGSGLSTLAGMGFLLLLRRERWQVLCSYMVFAVLTLILVWPEPQVLPQEMAAITPNAFFWSAPSLLLQYVSYPFSAWGDCRWLGMLVLLSASHSAYRCLRSANTPMTDFLLCYFFLIACSVVWGRYRFLAPDADLSRFYVYIAPLWFLVLLKLASFPQWLFRSVSSLLCSGLVLAGLAAVAVAADHAGRMDMARVVALNGNFAHLASLRLNAMAGQGSALQQHAGYLREQRMDIYGNALMTLLTQAPAAATCKLTLQRKAVVSRGAFVDYFFTMDLAGDEVLTALYATDEQLQVRYHGVAVAAANRMKGWQIPLPAVTLSDWPLLLPLSLLSRQHVLIYTHLPRHEQVASLQWWAVNRDGSRCRVLL